MKEATYVQERIDRAKRRIQDELNQLSSDVGEGWTLDVQVHQTHHHTFTGRTGVWSVTVEAKLETGQ